MRVTDLPGPHTIVGVGLNYLPHAADLAAKPTELPTLFFKGGHTIIGPGDAIPLPPMSRRVTAEAELGLVIGRRMYQVAEADALDYVAGGCCVLDQTAEDLLQLDSRMLTLSKNFPGGPGLDRPARVASRRKRPAQPAQCSIKPVLAG
jgi:2-keto-4-pentenoate hydratase/2-oxohepta-3-ene-1,7-dioic acid hydratase in catechol pathway